MNDNTQDVITWARRNCRMGESMNREQVIEQAKAVGWDAYPCDDPGFIAIRSYKATSPNERMRMGSNGEFYIQDEDGWMCQVGTVDDVANAVKARQA